MSNIQRKRKAPQPGKARSSKRRSRRGGGSSSTMTALSEPIELEESMVEVVDLTCESQEPVVDLTTHNDSVVIVEEHNIRGRSRGQSSAGIASCVLSSDDEDSRDIYNRAETFMDLESPSLTRSRSSGGNVSCPICMEGYSEITRNGRLIVATNCGHIFCSTCLRDALKHSNTCPTCRKKVTPKQYHPIYI